MRTRVLLRRMGATLNSASLILLPRRCVICQQVCETGCCELCLQLLPWITSACIGCGRALPRDAWCGACQQRPLACERSIIALRYQAPINELVMGLKFHHQLIMAEIFAEAMLRRLGWRSAFNPHADVRAGICTSTSIAIRPRNNGTNVEAQRQLRRLDHSRPCAEGLDLTAIDCITPVPLHPKRLAKRGYNQSLLIAKALAKRLDIPVDTSLVRRIRHTETQSNLPATKRRHNVRGAFYATAGLARHVVLVDDVVTTGHTINEISKALIKRGHRVEVWAVASAASRALDVF